MLPRAITRRVFLVPLANNDHGKTTIIRSLVHQGHRSALERVKRGQFTLMSPWGRAIDSLIIPRSYQETLEGEFGSIKNALQNIDPRWRERDLIVFSSHIVRKDCLEMIRLGRGAGFDVVAVPVLLEPGEILKHKDCLRLAWNERWTLCNTKTQEPTGQIEALGHDLWAWAAAALEHR